MQKTKIDWCDYSWNPVTGCLHGCEYCYARKIANRFGLDFAPIIGEFEGVLYDGDINGMVLDNSAIMYDLYKPVIKHGIKKPYPAGFMPTFHRYRLDEPQKIKKPKTVFVCSMADLFGDWVPDEWIKQVFEACEKAPQHRYLFLTKSRERYWELHDKGILPSDKNFWFGATMTCKADEYKTANMLPAYTGKPKPIHRNTFVSVEPILDDIESAHPMGGFFTYFINTIRWAIVGAETGNRKGKVIPKREWIDKIVSACHGAKVPVFMKESLRELMGQDFIQEFPW